jgi:molecular chaperone IbpA
MNTSLPTSYNPLDMFNDWFDVFKPLSSLNESSNYPPYNIVRKSDELLCIELALAGFTKDDVKVSADGNLLTVSGETTSDDRTYVHHGIAARKFTLQFRLGKNTEVVEAEMKDGMLMIDVSYLMPKKEEPKLIDIK